MRSYTAIAAALLLASGLSACSREERDDVQISSAARQELADERLPGAIEVTVTYGVATLSGSVPDAATKERAEDVVADVKGIDRVVNNLRATTAADAPARLPRSGGMQPPPLAPREALPQQPPVNPNAPSAPEIR
jgi:hypothetical protein